MKEDETDREVRYLSAQDHKKMLDTKKKKEKRKNIARQELERRRAKARRKGKPEEDSPDEDDEDDDFDDDDDAEGMTMRLEHLLQPPPQANTSSM